MCGIFIVTELVRREVRKLNIAKGRLSWGCPLTRVPETLKVMDLKPEHSTLTIAAYGWGLAMLPSVREVFAIDSSEEQIVYNRLTRSATIEFDRTEFFELLKLLLPNPPAVNFNHAQNHLGRRAIRNLSEHLSIQQYNILIDIFNEANLDINREYHHVDEHFDVVLDERKIGREFFPHLGNQEIYEFTRKKILADRYSVLKATLPYELERLKGRKFDRIFLANVFHFMRLELELLKKFLEELRPLLKDRSSFAVCLDLAATNGYYPNTINPSNAEIIAKIEDPGICRYTIFR